MVPKPTRSTDLPTGATQHLESALRGRVIPPGHADYDNARGVWNAAIDRHPALIVRAADAGDVARAIAFAREQGLPLSVRGGGHDVAGHAIVDDGLVLDMRDLRGVRVDPETRGVRAEAGLTGGDLGAALGGHALAVPGGKLSTTGIAGLTLGGGMGWLSRKHGLTIDSLLAAELVTADGEIIRASADERPELFWGLRGGGGNFGVVTALEFRAHPFNGMVYAGLVAYPLPQAAAVLRHFRDASDDLPDELGAAFAIIQAPDGSLIAGILMCYAGSLAEGEAATRPLRAFGAPVMEQVGPMPYPALIGIGDAAAPAGLRRAWRSSLLTELTDAQIDGLAEGYLHAPVPDAALILELLGGAVPRVAADATAFRHRDARFALALDAGYHAPADRERVESWLHGIYAALGPAGTRAAYVNYLGDKDEARIRAAYGDETYRRLAALKRRYDPENLFRSNQNIAPQA